MNNNPHCELYIHIPFCARKCSYCDFLSFPAAEETQRRYVSALTREIRSQATEEYKVRSVFLGGGTPSLLYPGAICAILDETKQMFGFLPDAEITIEANPGTLTAEKLAEYRRCGINRISLGCQSIFDDALRVLGRLHDAETFFRSLQLVKDAGFSNISVDLMSGIPLVTRGQWRETLECVAALGVPHISAYSLILEEGTPLFINQDNYAFPDEEALAEMYADTAEVLSRFGLFRYEISNYAKPGYESRHNLGYWTDVPYLGFGLGASSYRDGKRWRNTAELSRYLDAAGSGLPCREDVRQLTPEEMQAECMMLGLRLTEGVSLSDFARRFGRELTEVYAGPLRKHLRMGTLVLENGHLRIPAQYLFVSNQILSDFV